ncbi:GNAT family N-acetyltransferase [Saccharopolyspora rosea]|uniref:GNAT family N-acetyltransferase n=1 Tax=Saccharopolyspora rosea TaxID=524884 RepID=A0ABW3FPZ9_9PSEU|nr:N-acetyltransferase [Saccharopolyspora rosea]
MTAAPSPRCDRIAELSADQFRTRLAEALQIYVDAMGYPPATAQQRAPMWSAHVLRAGWRCIGAFNDRDELVGIGYGYQGAPGQWWHEQVRRGLQLVGSADPETWLSDYYELTELHVHPAHQGSGLGEEVLRRLLADVPGSNVLLSTPEGPTRAWRLYRRVGFTDVLRNYRFTGDPRPFAVLGRPLPLDPRSSRGGR